MSACFGICGSQDDERVPLLPRYEDDTSLQRQLHQKLHTYQMLRALSKGFMPSTDQAIVNLRSLLAADYLKPDHADLSDSGRAVVHYTRRFLTQVIDVLQHKNTNDQIQDFIWYLAHARISVDAERVGARISKAKKKADTAAGTTTYCACLHVY
jgi:hypothetical protein